MERDALDVVLIPCTGRYSRRTPPVRSVVILLPVRSRNGESHSKKVNILL